jgi:Mn2+/Fe2+ NRAMP family transporter
MQTEYLPVKPYATQFGVIFGAFSILILVLLYLFDYETNTAISILNLIVTASIVWYAIHLYKIDNNGLIDLTTSIKLGLAIGVIGGLIYGAYTYLHYELVQPEYVTEMKTAMEAEMEAQIEQQQMSDEEAEMTRNMSGVFASPFVLGTISLLSIIFKTFIVALIVGMIKRNN